MGQAPGPGLALQGFLGPAQLLGDQAPLSPGGLAAAQGVLGGEQLLVRRGQAVRLADYTGYVGVVVMPPGGEPARGDVHGVLHVQQNASLVVWLLAANGYVVLRSGVGTARAM